VVSSDEADAFIDAQVAEHEHKFAPQHWRHARANIAARTSLSDDGKTSDVHYVVRRYLQENPGFAAGTPAPPPSKSKATPKVPEVEQRRPDGRPMPLGRAIASLLAAGRKEADE
jgi:hypothetical protein